MNHLKLSFTVLAASLVAACGGGGGSAPPVAQSPPVVPPVVTIDPNMTVPARTALGSIATNGFAVSYTASGWTGPAQTPITGSGTITQGAASTVTLNGASALRSTQVQTGTLIAGGTSTPISSVVTEYTAPDTFSRLADETATSYTAYAPYTLPVTVKAGDVGQAWQGKRYKSSSSMVDPGLGRVVGAYVVAKDSASSLLVTFIVDSYGNNCDVINTSGGGCIPANHVNDPSYIYTTHVSHEQSVYRVSTSGTVSFVSVQADYYTTTGSIGQSLILKF